MVVHLLEFCQLAPEMEPNLSRFFLQLNYDGTAYHGWQMQENSITVQQLLNEKISRLLRHDIKLVGCGRTDAGVHASVFFAHFDGPEIAEPERFLFKLNNMLPHDIGVQRIIPVPENAHSRFSATHRQYQYRIHTQKDPFLRPYSWFQPFSFDVTRMNEACEILKSHSDFAAFCKAGGDQKTTLCRIDEARWEQFGPSLIFTIGADRFLRNMVRAIVGTMKEIGLGKMNAEELERIIVSKSRSEAGVSVPAHGLFLTNVTYPFL